MTTFFQKLRATLGMIKFSHSIFALPFALTSTFYATGGQPSLRQVLLIIAAMVTARSAAMSFNRIVDRDLDAKNPRTKNRELPSGKLSLGFTVGFCVACSGLFIAVASLFNTLTLLLSPVALAIILGYSLTKRFTHYTQFFLGLSLAIAPLAAWIALTGRLEAFPAWIATGVFFWVTGFDLIYSTQDHDFDKANGLNNLVVRLGIAKALLLARVVHGLAISAFVLAGLAVTPDPVFFSGIAIMAGVLLYEHSLVKPHDLSRVDMAFFTLNGSVALIFFGFSLAALYL